MGIMANTNLTNQRQVFAEAYVRSGANHKTSSSGIVNADRISTVSLSSLPILTLDNSSTFTVSIANSRFTAFLANAGLSAISHTMLCYYTNYSSGVHTYSLHDVSDDTVLNN